MEKLIFRRKYIGAEIASEKLNENTPSVAALTRKSENFAQDPSQEFLIGWRRILQLF